MPIAPPPPPQAPSPEALMLSADPTCLPMVVLVRLLLLLFRLRLKSPPKKPPPPPSSPPPPAPPPPSEPGSLSVRSDSHEGGARASIGLVAPKRTPEPGGGPAPLSCASQSAACTQRYGRRSAIHARGWISAGKASTMAEHWWGDGVRTARLSPVSMSCQSVQHDAPREHSARTARASRSATGPRGTDASFISPPRPQPSWRLPPLPPPPLPPLPLPPLPPELAALPLLPLLPLLLPLTPLPAAAVAAAAPAPEKYSVAIVYVGPGSHATNLATSVRPSSASGVAPTRRGSGHVTICRSAP